MRCHGRRHPCEMANHDAEGHSTNVANRHHAALPPQPRATANPSRARFRPPYFIRDGSLMVRPATMNSPRPRWCSARAAATAGSTEALTTSSTKKQ